MSEKKLSDEFLREYKESLPPPLPKDVRRAGIEVLESFGLKADAARLVVTLLGMGGSVDQIAESFADGEPKTEAKYRLVIEAAYKVMFPDR